MWLYLIAIVVLIVGIVGGIATGGIFMIIFIPLGLVALASAVGYGQWQRSAERRAGANANAHPATGNPLPHTPSGDPGHVTTSPDALTDARRVQQ